MKEQEGLDKIFYEHANADFRGLANAPKPLFFSSKDSAGIDGDIILIDIIKKIMKNQTSFRQGAEVFYHNELCYFLLLENDMGNPDYRVRYTNTMSPFRPLNISEKNLILEKIPEHGNYGTGHNSVIQTTDSDTSNMVYHRFIPSNRSELEPTAVYNREFCIDKLKLNTDGSIKPLVPKVSRIN
ncbi:family 43 glycosylhydrolase [Aestuariibaculum sediminum]|uniref:Family 43 glycosylhydrolase n=1 Tax=Aestuariibaculum sediminum TaxID=2770637 RepID=A0A8J6QI72_9FLAO|nr:family 43 glycosylhydrolase [Aestuariibaculum sediminum]MBD0832539.1 family 43 glycosylhydrolase [Aestuariibaculum sediminum]